jgi:TonB family protein
MRHGLIVGLFLLFLSVTSSIAAGGLAEQELLSTAASLVDLGSSNAKPFQLDADIKAQLNVPVDGHLTLKWVAKNRWWRKTTMGDYSELNIRNGDMLYTKRNGPFTPLRVRELFRLISVFEFDPTNWQVKKTKMQMINGVKAECIDLRERGDEKSKHAVCFNSLTKEPIRHEIRYEETYRISEFSDYAIFQEHSYPRNLKFSAAGRQMLLVEITSLQDVGLDEASLLVPPPGASARRQCEHMQRAKQIYAPDPAYPSSAWQNGIGGTVVVAFTVLENGSVDNLQIVGSADQDMDKVTQQIIKTWKFKSAMCGTEPVASDVQAEVNFKRR